MQHNIYRGTMLRLCHYLLLHHIPPRDSTFTLIFVEPLDARLNKCLSGHRDLRFDVRIGEAVDVHSSQVGAASHPHTQPPTPLSSFVSLVWWGEELQGEQQATSLLQTLELLILPLQGKQQRGKRVTLFSRKEKENSSILHIYMT